MHTINMSHNNLTRMERDWFESFHTKWEIGEREFAGKLILDTVRSLPFGPKIGPTNPVHI